VRAFEQWPLFSEIDQPLAWVWTVAWRIANRSAHRDSRRIVLETLAAHPSMESPHDTGWLHDLVDELAALRPEHASALRLTQLEDLDANDAAAALGVSPGTVKVRYRLCDINFAATAACR
jgi:DNA-directed RNA polymerase specialized sigma24 family protein